jgi:hypothetical protein
MLTDDAGSWQAAGRQLAGSWHGTWSLSRTLSSAASATAASATAAQRQRRRASCLAVDWCCRSRRGARPWPDPTAGTAEQRRAMMMAYLPASAE